MPDTLTYTGELTVLTCWCGMRHAVPTELRNHQLKQRDNGQEPDSVYCPLGHSHVPSGEGKADRLEKQLQAERDRAARLRARLDQEEAYSRAQKGRATRFKNERDRLKTRTGNGVCPCCNRTFKQLARHMANKHPDFPASGHDGGTDDA